jgi:ATP-dependent helicase HrpB
MRAMAATPQGLNALPIDSVMPRLRELFDTSLNMVLQAPPGAGKTTRVPLALLDAAWLAGRRIIVLEPRRLAARAAARRMAALRGEAVGDTVGYRMRMDTKVGPKTRIEVVTDGVFVRMLQQNPALDGIGLVIFDEIHERGLDGDLNLALCLEVQGALRPDLHLLAMSATLDGAAIARLLGDAPVLTSDGRSFPVETVHLERPEPGAVEDAVAATVRRALAETGGDLLVFLPGAAEIRLSRRAWTGCPAPAWRRCSASCRRPSRTPRSSAIRAAARSCSRRRSPRRA